MMTRVDHGMSMTSLGIYPSSPLSFRGFNPPLVPRQATFARQGAASGACSRRAGRKPSYWTYLGFRSVRRECVPGVATGRTLPAAALAAAPFTRAQQPQLLSHAQEPKLFSPAQQQQARPAFEHNPVPADSPPTHVSHENPL